jgi:hypothetical protein
VSACFNSPACRSVSVWGLSDPNSWLNSNGCTQGMIMLDTQPAPLVFDEAFGRKPALVGHLRRAHGLRLPVALTGALKTGRGYQVPGAGGEQLQRERR